MSDMPGRADSDEKDRKKPGQAPFATPEESGTVSDLKLVERGEAGCEFGNTLQPPGPCEACNLNAQQIASVTAASALASKEQKELRKLLPHLNRGFWLSVIICLLVKGGLVNETMVGLFGLLPLQIYWGVCLYKLIEGSSRKYRTKSIAAFISVFVSLLAYFTFPHPIPGLSPSESQWLAYESLPGTFSYNCFSSLLHLQGIDFFYVWLFTQLVWPFLFFNAVPVEKKRWWQVLLTCFLANSYLCFFSPTPFVLKQVIFELSWIVWQFGCILYLIVWLKTDHSRSSKRKEKASEAVVTFGDDTVLRYRSFAAIERWRKDQERALQKEMRGVIALCVPVLLLMYCLGLHLIANGPAYTQALMTALNRQETTVLAESPGQTDKAKIHPESSQPTQLTPAPATGTLLSFLDFADPRKAQSTGSVPATNLPLEQTANRIFILIFVIAGATLGLMGICHVYSKPTHLAIGIEGWRFLWRRKFQAREAACANWQNMRHIYLKQARGKTSALEKYLCFKMRNGTVHKLRLDCLDSQDDRELLLKCIEKYGYAVRRDPEVIQALQPPADHSYTELWLQALSAPPKRERLKPLSAGASLQGGDYQVIEQLGAGGQGQAYLARSKTCDELIVLKEFVLPVYVDGNVRRAALEQFENEARILKALNYPQIVKLLNVFVEDHRAYLVLEHIKGESLKDLVKRNGKLSEKDVRLLAAQMCEILGYLHGLSPPVVHRDFTPDNLILNADGKLKLIDFNVARQVVQATTSGTVVGKHAYLPPEQFRGMPERGSDIYAMGATLHFLLTAQEPVPISVSHPKLLTPDLSDSMNRIVEQATCLDLQGRYHSVEELRDDITLSWS